MKISLSKKKSRGILFLFIVIAALWIIHGFYKVQKVTIYSPVFSLTNPAEYDNLFNTNAKTEMILDESINTLGRNPISNFTYKKKYSVVVYKIRSSISSSLREFIQTQTREISRNSQNVYNSVQLPGFQLSFMADSISEVSHIFFTIYGDSITRVIDNDSVIDYNLFLNTVSVRYGQVDAEDITIEKAGTFSSNVPLELVFINKRSGLFLITISNINSRSPISKELVNKLFSKN